jgi:hypothetical protein
MLGHADSLVAVRSACGIPGLPFATASSSTGGQASLLEW